MVTRRCTQRQFQLRRDQETTNAFIYCLAQAAERTALRMFAFRAHSNHHHTILVETKGRKSNLGAGSGNLGAGSGP